MSLDNYARLHNPVQTPQTEQIRGTSLNNAGGYSFTLDRYGRLRRFLILGSDGGTYYVSSRQLTKDNAVCVMECLEDDHKKTLDIITEVDVKGYAPKKDATLFALALALSHDNSDIRSYASSCINDICRTGGQFLDLMKIVMQWRGSSRALRRAVSNWFVSRDVSSLAYQTVKYRRVNAGGWSYRDLLRFSHPLVSADDIARKALFSWLCNKEVNLDDLPSVVKGFELASKASNAKEIVRLIEDYDLPREAIPTEFLNEVPIWEALLPKMPITALIRNLGKMTSLKMLDPLSANASFVVNRISDADVLKKGRVHPMNVLFALKAYANGASMNGRKSSLVWESNAAITDALDGAFYLCFDNVEATHKRHLLALDVSYSMNSPISSGSSLSCCEASAALAMITLAKEPNSYVFGFANSGLVDLKITKSMTLGEATKRAHKSNFGATDCSLPMVDALKNNMAVDAFVVYTDNETYAGRIHPQQALNMYRKKTGIQAKQVVVGMTATQLTIADPNDPLTLDVVGFDASAPSLMNHFIRG